ncbi:UNVERIFIED_CONTAM: hypothetical protein Sradi_6466800 [Sesamum radiatum]|uniref:Zinc finger PHD-type domain-containing protein n=1 Tax=Sesamum radiatum TaxID=300843 RepID=A0AAW2K802_SESRA
MECLCISYPLSYPKVVNHLQRNTMISVQYVRMEEICYAVKTVQEAFTPEKFAEPDANALAAGRVPGVDPLEAITQWCIRVVGTFEPEIGGCAICRRHDFCKSKFTARTIIICDQCEKEYHVGCVKEQNMDDLKELPEGDWFCCRPCNNINSALQKLIGDGEQRLPEALSDVMKMKCEGQDPHKNPELGIRWRLLRGKKATEDSRVWLSGAVNIFLDRFDPISDAGRGRVDLIPHMVYGRHLEDQDFCGMYCAVLMVEFWRGSCRATPNRNNERVSGKASLDVKHLVLPVADEAQSLWRNRFRFQKLGQEQVAQCLPSSKCAFLSQQLVFNGFH